MKRKGLYLLCFLILPVLLLVSFNVFADENSGTERTTEVKPKIEKYDLSHYRSLYHEEGDWNPFGEEEVTRQINNVSEFFLSMSKMLASMTDYAIAKLFNQDVLEDFGDKVGLFVGNIYQGFLNNLALTLFIIVCFNAFIIFSVKGDAREALKRAFLIFCLVGFGVGVLGNAGNIIRMSNGIGKDFNNVIMNSTTSINQNVDYKNEESGMNYIRNQFFDMTIYRTYLMMNYGSVDENQIKDKGKDRIDNILKLDFSKNSEKDLKEKVKFEVEKKDNVYMTQGYAFQKLGVSFVGFLITLFMSAVFLAISIAKLIFSTFALILFIFLVFSWIISFLPNFELSVFSAFAKTLGYIILSTCMTFLFVIVGFCIDLANMFIKPTNQDAYMLNCIFVVLILVVLFKKRHQIINFVSRGNVSFSPSKIGAETIQHTQNKWNDLRQKQSENKKQKRVNQQPNPERNDINSDSPKRKQQDKPMPMFFKDSGNSKNKQRRQQQETMHGQDTGSHYHENEPSYSYSKEPQKSRQQEHQVRDIKPKKDIQRSPQTVSTYTNSQSQSDRTMNRNEQKKIQTSADNNIEKRQVQGANNHQHYRQSGIQNKPITRNDQSEQRLKEQKDINKHGK
ncbi:CD3337/EF1877 family mobilome membrane protein [Staphylococcus aureus]|uniref:CD3337/EF1877 family mobilome membrane protein n=1 Tax=Staphylococcus aureus TaxID=1280 RepID=UPI00132C35C2|nr:hypothetical protein [Staphylococcus aureus]MWU72811.1 hypothetical protein [Staphylococcus aureus]